MPLTMRPDRALFSGREGLKGLHHLQKANGRHFAAIPCGRRSDLNLRQLSADYWCRSVTLNCVITSQQPIVTVGRRINLM